VSDEYCLAVKFQGSITQIAALLKEDHGYSRAGGVEALAMLATQGKQHVWTHMVSLTNIAVEFQGSIGTYIPQIINLLQDNESFVRMEAVAALLKLWEQGMLHISPGIVSDKYCSRVSRVH
jgi:hypothetical protein